MISQIDSTVYVLLKEKKKWYITWLGIQSNVFKYMLCAEAFFSDHTDGRANNVERFFFAVSTVVQLKLSEHRHHVVKFMHGSLITLSLHGLTSLSVSLSHAKR